MARVAEAKNVCSGRHNVRKLKVRCLRVWDSKRPTDRRTILTAWRLRKEQMWLSNRQPKAGICVGSISSFHLSTQRKKHMISEHAHGHKRPRAVRGEARRQMAGDEVRKESGDDRG
jgi:hypothetical protein